MVADRAPEGLFVGLPLFRFVKVLLAGDLPIGPGLDLKPLAQVFEQEVYDGLRPFPCLVEQAQVVGIGNVLVGHRCIELELALVGHRLGVPRGLRAAMAYGRQYVGETVEGILAEPLPPFHEQGRRKDLRRRELAKPEEELHVRVFPDGTYRLPVAQAELVLDDRAADHDPRIDGRPAAVGEVPGVDLGALVPREMGRKLYPPVGRVEFHLVKIAEFLNFELVLGSVLYHMQGIFVKVRNTLH